MKKKPSGFTLIEVILSTTIGILMISGAYYVYNAREKDVKVRLTADSVKTVLADADAITITSSDYSIDPGGGPRPVNIQDIIEQRAGTVPNSFSQAAPGASVYSVYNGVVFMDAAPSSPASVVNDTVRVTLANVPSDACPRLLALLATHAYDLKVGAGGGSTLVHLTPARSAGTFGRTDINQEQAVTLCRQAPFVSIFVRRLKDIQYTSLRPVPFGPMTPAVEAVVQAAFDRNESAMNEKESAQVALGLD